MKLLTKDLQKSSKNSKIFYIYKEKFKDKKYLKVRDPCRYTGECRGATHSTCKLKYIVYLKKFLQFFAMDLTIIKVLS